MKQIIINSFDSLFEENQEIKIENYEKLKNMYELIYKFVLYKFNLKNIFKLFEIINYTNHSLYRISFFKNEIMIDRKFIILILLKIINHKYDSFYFNNIFKNSNDKYFQLYNLNKYFNLKNIIWTNRVRSLNLNIKLKIEFFKKYFKII